MSKYIYILLILFIISCSNEDNNLPTIEMEKFYGKWYTRKGCEDQNFMIFSENGIYSNRYSFNETCATNESNTFESTANYTVIRNEINYDFLTIGEVIIEGSNDNTATTVTDINYSQERVIELTDEIMVIETEIRHDYRETRYYTTTFYRSPN
ncbi:hypothetical protein ACSIGC_15680 [Tenacibaculum sp. ZS6-P6]|uniref:hypothetical protein n=1 Tax=Tenacibaculum sp. ZS6-P6 TaxID=3447503 RepID=UPI003F946539